MHILAELAQAKNDVSTQEWGLSGTLRVSCVSSLTQAYLADDICEFRKQHPDLQIDFTQHDRYCDPVQEGYDISIQTDMHHSAILEKVEIAPINRLIVASPAYLKKYGTPQHPEELQQHVLAHNRYIHPDNVMRFDSYKGPEALPLTPVITSTTITLLRSALIQGECLARMPLFYIEKEILEGYLVPLLTLARRLCALFIENRYLSP